MAITNNHTKWSNKLEIYRTLQNTLSELEICKLSEMESYFNKENQAFFRNFHQWTLTKPNDGSQHIIKQLTEAFNRLSEKRRQHLQALYSEGEPNTPNLLEHLAAGKLQALALLQEEVQTKTAKLANKISGVSKNLNSKAKQIPLIEPKIAPLSATSLPDSPTQSDSDIPAISIIRDHINIEHLPYINVKIPFTTENFEQLTLEIAKSVSSIYAYFLQTETHSKEIIQSLRQQGVSIDTFSTNIQLPSSEHVQVFTEHLQKAIINKLVENREGSSSLFRLSTHYAPNGSLEKILDASEITCENYPDRYQFFPFTSDSSIWLKSQTIHISLNFKFPRS